MFLSLLGFYLNFIYHRFEIPVVNAKGGQPITEERLDDILRDMTQISPKPQVRIVVLGKDISRYGRSTPH